jgi:FlaA1/EpsC-like NDP-sugar epimerase
MPVILIKDLAVVMIEELGPRYGHEPSKIEIREIGTKPGEKLYEELMSSEETRRAIELKSYFSVLPAFRGLYKSIQYDYPETLDTEVSNPYISAEEKTLGRDDLRKFLLTQSLLMPGTGPMEGPDSRYWPGDKEERG